MVFQKNLFIALFTVAIGTIQILNAMEPERLIALEKSDTLDFQIYQIFSAATKNNSQVYLPDEVTHAIIMNVHEITEKLRQECKECYEKYGIYLSNATFFNHFIIDSLEEFMSETTIVNILKTCLSYSGKSVSEIRNWSDYTVFSDISCSGQVRCNLQGIKIICLVAGDQIWDLITMKKDSSGNTVLHDFFIQAAESQTTIENELRKPHPDRRLIQFSKDFLYPSQAIIKELLSMAPSPQQAWLLINAPNNKGQTPLSLVKLHGKTEFIELFESYRPNRT